MVRSARPNMVVDIKRRTREEELLTFGGLGRALRLSGAGWPTYIGPATTAHR